MALDFVAGCLGGCAGIVVGYPLDTVKVHMQTQDHRNPIYRGTWQCLGSIVKKESVSGLYRGMSSPMAGVAVVNAIIFGVYGQAQKQFSEPEHLSSHFLAGASAGIAQSPIAAPIELAKTRMQLQSSSSPSHSGPVACLQNIYQRHGTRGLFNGYLITLLRETPSFGVYFLTYEALTRRSDADRPISTITMLLAGGLAGTLSWVISYPLDVIKSRLQADVNDKYRGIMDCYRQSIRTEGYSCLYRGINSTIIRAFPTNAATFAVVSWTYRLFQQQQQEATHESSIQNSAYIQRDSQQSSLALITNLKKEKEDLIFGDKTRTLFASISSNPAARLLAPSYTTSASLLSIIKVSMSSYLDKNEHVVEGSGLCKFCREDLRLEWLDVGDAIIMCRCNLQRVINSSDLSNAQA